MNKKLTYQPPRVLQGVNVLLERDFLGGSIVDDTLLIETVDQDVVEMNADSDEFEWNRSDAWTWE